MYGTNRRVRWNPMLGSRGGRLSADYCHSLQAGQEAAFDPLLKYGGLKSGHPQQMERASTMFMSTKQAIERLRLATDSPSMRTVRSALDGQDRTASTGCLWQGDRQA